MSPILSRTEMLIEAGVIDSFEVVCLYLNKELVKAAKDGKNTLIVTLPEKDKCYMSRVIYDLRDNGYDADYEKDNELGIIISW